MRFPWSRSLRKRRRSIAADDLPPQGRTLERLFLPGAYVVRATPKYYNDPQTSAGCNLQQPDVYTLAATLAALSSRRIVDAGCGKGMKLQPWLAGFEVVGIDHGSNIEHCRRTHASGRWIEHDFDGDPPLPPEVLGLQPSILVCADVIEHLRRPVPFLRELKRCADLGACVLISTPDRRLLRQGHPNGPPPNPTHLREWTLGEFRALLEEIGFAIPFLGLTANNTAQRRMSTMLAVLTAPGAPAMPAMRPRKKARDGDEQAGG